MLLKFNLYFSTFPLISESSIVMLLTVVTVFFGILLLLGVRKSYKLKKENERLEAMNTKASENTDNKYKDFTGGHMYGGN
ncbi:hypothetical protein [Algibacter pectinivorans]|uniref:Uncharacterized protein n=1 Tax=Algibacter pectinivorans TaxID=870482 RepID=A0A1I1PG90_9FLAO|nr:hypothetical protein [Algibacter pectinivorans]SFD06658.1 hypothetical protein SAMN04487987_103323 [Algibacter pectinivorans]